MPVIIISKLMTIGDNSSVSQCDYNINFKCFLCNFLVDK